MFPAPGASTKICKNSKGASASSCGRPETFVKDLQKAQILFEDPILASKHLNKIWENVDDWWESEEVKKVRNSFFKKAALVEPEALEKWKNFFLNL